jgi:uncharacterized membrane protein
MGDDILYATVLRPHRSVSLYGINVLFGLLASVWTAVGITFAHFGAWPVSGFLGVDLVAVYTVLYVHHRGGRVFEEIRLTQEALTLRRVDRWGRERVWRLAPHWLQVSCDERLELRSRGERIVIGGFLRVEDRRHVAQELRLALAKIS